VTIQAMLVALVADPTLLKQMRGLPAAGELGRIVSTCTPERRV